MNSRVTNEALSQPAASVASRAVPSDLPSDCRLDHPDELAAILRRFLDRELPLSLSAPDGTVLSTSLWAEDRVSGLIVFSVGTDVDRAERVAQCNEAVAVGYLDHVRLQFDVSGLVLVHGNDACALNAEYPSAMMRFQRRDAYRVRPLEHAQPTVHVTHPRVPDALLRMRVTDISHGGIALVCVGGVGPFQLGQELPDAVLELDHLTQVSMGLRVVRVEGSAAQGEGAGATWRLGCEMVDLRGEDARVLQRYIDNTQRRRRMLTL
jgi:c-di-GMP-binding flagellar brake protein YcgR